MEEQQSVEMDNTLDKITRHIYANCDSENTDSLPVSLLVEFLGPYMPNNLNHLHELQALLDPQGVNPSISRSTFYNAMTEWTKQLQQKQADSVEDNSNCSRVDTPPFTQSTPRAGGDYGQIMNKFSEMLNNSDVSVYDSNPIVSHNKTNHEEQIKELQCQLTKVTYQLELAKEQLITAEEENNSLLSELKYVKNALHSEQLTVKQCKRDKLELEELQVQAELAISNIRKLEASLAKSEKEREILLDEIKTIENQKLQVKNQIQEAETCILQLQKELLLKESDISTYIKSQEELQATLNETQELVVFCTRENRFLHEKVECLEKVFQEKIERDDAIGSRFNQNDDVLFKTVFQSPKLIAQINQPISPLQAGSPIMTNGGQKSPPFCGKTTLLKQVLLKNTSTLNERAILDYTLPGEMKNCPTLSPEGHNELSRLRRIKSLDLSSVDKESPPTLYYSVERFGEKIQNGSDVETIFQKGIPTKLRSPHKSLKDEIDEALIDANKENFEGDVPDSDIRNVHQLLKDEEYTNNLLPETIQLAEDLVLELQQKDQAIKDLKGRCKTLEAGEKMRKDNEISLQKSEQIVTDLCLKLEKHESFTIVDETNDSTCDFVGKVSRLQSMILRILSRLEEEALTESLQVTGTNVSTHNGTSVSQNSTCALSKANSFSKLQLKIERLEDKLEKSERYCETERNLNGDLKRKNRELIVENSQIKAELETGRKLINDLVQQQKDLQEKAKCDRNNMQKESLECINNLKDDKEILHKELTHVRQLYSALQEQNQKLLSEKDALNSQVLALGNAVIRSLKEVKQELINDMQRKQEFNAIHQSYEERILKLEDLIKEKENQILVISNNFKELCRTTSAMINRIKSLSEPDFDQVVCDLLTMNIDEEMKFSNRIEEEMFRLSSNVKLAMALLEVVVGKLEKPIKNIVDDRSSLNRAMVKYNYIPGEHVKHVVEPSCNLRTRFYSRLGVYVKSLFVFLIISFVLLFVYVQWMCTRNGKNRICPVDFLLEKIIKKTPSGLPPY